MKLYRVFTTIILLGFALSGFSQHTLTIEIENCKKKEADPTFKQFILKKGHDSDTVSIGTFKPQGKSILHISNLGPGWHELHYTNKFNLPKHLNIFINPTKDTTSKVLCSDRYNNGEINHIPIISKIRNGEEFSIIFRSTPHSLINKTVDTLTIDRVNDVFYLSHNGKKRLVINPEEFYFIQKFETELNLFNREETCDHFDTYEIIFEEGHHLFTDVSCEWKGGTNLLHHLKLLPTVY
jgi:hypothetical protein